MLHTILLSLSITMRAGPSTDAAPATEVVASTQENAEYEQRRKAAGDDVDKLWQLHSWCKEKRLDKESRSTLRRIVKLDPEHKDANEALGNVLYDGKWFPSQKKVDEYKKAQEEKKAKEQGLVNYKGQLVPSADVPFLEKGLVKDESGNWVDGEERKKIKEGWVKQDMEWVPPTEKAEMDKGLWKCGEQWLSLEEANKYHADLAHWWRIPGPHFTLYTTCDRDVATEKVKKNLEFAWEDLAKVYGQEPKDPVIVVILRNTKQYNLFAAGDQEEQIPPTESEGLCSIHFAYFADEGLDPATGAFMAAGVSYWDASTNDGNAWGRNSVRHALGQSFGEAIDPSPKALEKMRKLKTINPKALWAEKRAPTWLRWGAAAYAERYFIDTLVERGGNNRWAPEWAIKNLIGRGGLRPLKQVFECKITVDSPEDSEKLISETGLMVSFMVDGDCAPVKEKFKVLQLALKDGKDAKAVSTASEAVQSEVLKHEAELRKFAGM